jgi:hypothetical protein
MAPEGVKKTHVIVTFSEKLSRSFFALGRTPDYANLSPYPQHDR